MAAQVMLENARPREYRSQNVPGQKTEAVVIRISQRDLHDPNRSESIGTIVPMIHSLAPLAHPSREKQI